MSAISLFIHSALVGTTDEYVRDVFQSKLRLGVVEKVDLIDRRDNQGRDYKMVYVHMESWNATPDAEKVLADIRETGKTKVFITKKAWWTLAENTYVKSVRQSADFTTPTNSPVYPAPPMLVRNDNAPMLSRCSSIDSECARDLLPEFNSQPMYKLLRHDNAPALNRFDSIDNANMFPVTNLVDDSYVQQLEQENAWLHSVIEHQNAMMESR